MSIEPPSITVELLAESLARTDCRNDGRDFCCSYHDGFTDGINATLNRLGVDDAG